MFHKEYNFLVEQFHIGAPTLTLVKNVCATSTGAIQYQINLATIFAMVVNEDIIVRLILLHRFYNKLNAQHVATKVWK
jgi:hypothetical protein